MFAHRIFSRAFTVRNWIPIISRLTDQTIRYRTFHWPFHSQSNHYSNTYKKVNKTLKILLNTEKYTKNAHHTWCNLCKVSTRIIRGTCLVQKVSYESDFNAPWQIQILPYVLISRRNSLTLTSLGKIVYLFFFLQWSVALSVVYCYIFDW